MATHLDTVFSPSLYLDRDKRALAFIEDRLVHQESCSAVCLYGNGKDYLFTNVVKQLEGRRLSHTLKVLNTVSADELQEFASSLQRDQGPTMCLVNLRIGTDVSWFIRTLDQLRVTRGHAFVSFVSSYIGDVYGALQTMQKPVTHSLVVLERVPYRDALHVIAELSARFDFYPTEAQQQDIYAWSQGHVGLLRTLFLLKRQWPERPFAPDWLLLEPTILERLHNIVRDVPASWLPAPERSELGAIEQTLLRQCGFVDDVGGLFHPLLARLLPGRPQTPALFSTTEERVLAYLRARPGQIVSREAIARLVWGEEEWQDKYSDWAIGQLVYRLRKKLGRQQPAVTIETRKEQGFVWQAQPAAFVL